MLSIAQIQNLKQGLSYYQQDNYYAKDDAIGFTQWYGKAAAELGLVGKVNLDSFSKALHGVSVDGKLGNAKGNKGDDDAISYEKLFQFKKETKEYVTALKVSEESKLQIQTALDKISTTPNKLKNVHLEKCHNQIASIVNRDAGINMDERIKIKDDLRKKIDIFKKIPARRPGYDLTFSAPKSISLASLVGGDKALIDAHREAVNFSLKILEEEYSQSRVRDSNQSQRIIEVTGNVAVAQFEHDVSRKTDPQLHTHCVVMNLTKRSDNSWRSIYQDGFYYDSKKIGLIYQNELAKRVKSLGYEIKVNKNGTFDLIGYTEEQLKQFSKRTEQLRELGASSQKEASKIVKVNRNKKDETIENEKRLNIWKDEALNSGIVHPEKKNNSQNHEFLKTLIEVYKISQNKETKEQKFLNLIENSINDLTNNDVSFKKSKLETMILDKTIGEDDYNYHEIKNKIDEYLEKNAIKTPSNLAEYVPKNLVAIEKYTINIMQRGKDIFESILTKEEARKITDEIHKKSLEFQKLKGEEPKGLNQGQRGAIELSLTTNDRVICWQGVAGAGKSFSLGEVNRIATENNFIVKGFSPKADAAKVLAAEAKLSEAHTVASLLLQKIEAGSAQGKEIWIIDEAGMLSAADAKALLKKAEMANARLILVGDTRQLSSVGAGHPFKQLQQYGIETAYLDEAIRQKDSPLMKKAVDLIASGKHKDGLEVLDKSNKVFEMKTTEDTIVNMAKDYLELDKNERENSLFISSTNREKEEVTNLVRAELKSKGDLKESFSMITYAALDYNEHALKYSRVYNVGDVVILNKKAQGLESNKPYTLTALNETKNTITVKTDKGTKEIQVTKVNCSLFREESIEICEGDKMKWTKNHFSASPSKSNDGKFKDEVEKIKSQIEKNELEARKKERRLNGECFTVKKLDKDLNVAIIEYENGKQESVDLKNKQFIDYSYISTVHSSQGKTCNKVYASLSRVDKENFYVAVSRARFDCKLYVTNKEHLYENVLKSGANKTAKEKISTPQKPPLEDDFGLLNEEVAQKITDIKNKDMKKLIGNEIALARLNRKIKESSFEVIYKLNLEPEQNDLEKLYKIGKTNQEIVAKLLHKEVNTSFGVDGFLNCSTLPAKHLFEAYKKSPVFVEQTLRKLESGLNPQIIQPEIVQKQQSEQQKSQIQVERPRQSKRMRIRPR